MRLQSCPVRACTTTTRYNAGNDPKALRDGPMPITPNQLANILDVTEDGIVTVDAERRITLFNHGAEKIFGYAQAEALGQPLELLLPERYRAAHPEQVAGFGRSHESARRMGERREVLGIRKDGTEFPAEVSISKFASGRDWLYTAIVRDVTERKQFEAAERELERLRAAAQLADTEARLDAVVRSTQEGIAILDGDRKVMLFNPAAERLFGCAPGTAIGKPIGDFLGATYSFPAVVGAPDETVEVAVRNPAGREIALEVSRSRVNDGGHAMWALIIRDISERKRIEAELQSKTEEVRATTRQLWQAARLAGVGELAASIAHELNNPLGTVSLRIEGVLAKTPADDPRRRPLEVVEQEVERMASLVSNLLQFSRAGRDQVSTVDVSEEVAKTVDLIRHHLQRHGIEIRTEAAHVPVIYADRQQLRQVLLNLFTNAGDAMPGGGTLTVRLRPDRLAEGHPAIVIEVADTGSGIPPELLPKVFEPFFTTKEEGKGTGLGLAICRRIVHEHNGKIELQSRAREGTTVRITLPLRTEKNVAELDPR